MSPEEDRTRDTMDSEPMHYQLSYSGPRMEFEPMLTPREKSPIPKMSPEEDRTRNTVDSEPKHYQLSYSVSLYKVRGKD